MSADGAWKITLSTPMGPQEMTAQLKVEGAALTGSVESQMGSEAISGAADGDSLKWKLSVTKPMPIVLDFDVKVDGDKMTGTVKLGMFGNAGLSGERI